MKHIKLVDLEKEFLSIKSEMMPVIEDVIANARFIQSSDQKAFEQRFAEYCQAKYAVGVASGTAALHLAIASLGIGPGDEVITSAMSFNATAEAILYAGATPVFVDVHSETLSIDESKIEAAITERTKAILPVHLYGIPAEMDTILAIAQKHNLFVIEDCAQAHGTTYKGVQVGTFGEIGCFSFMPAKNLGSYGDAGGNVTQDEGLANRLRKLRDHGRTSKYVHDELGYAERMDNLQAAILDVKLKHLKAWNERRTTVAKMYDAGLDRSKITPVPVPPHAESSYYTYVFKTPKRDALREALEAQGIATNIYYPVPLHMQPMFATYGYKEGQFPVVEQAAKEILSIPIHPFLTDEEVSYIIENVNKYA